VHSTDVPRDPDPNADKLFAVKRWVNWDTAVAEVEWPTQTTAGAPWYPGDTRDFFDAFLTEYNEIEDGDLVTTSDQ
jgi:hypothetical protein